MIRLPWQSKIIPLEERKRADAAIDEVRIELRSLAHTLDQAIDRIERIEEQVGVNAGKQKP